MSEVPPKHCDLYIDDPSQPEILRKFLGWHRMAAWQRFEALRKKEPIPEMFADYKHERVRVVMASRLGDVGIIRDYHREKFCNARVYVADLSNFSEKP